MSMKWTVVIVGLNYDSGSQITNAVIGAFGLLSIIPIIAGVVLGHLSLKATVDNRARGRLLGAFGLAIGYVFLVLWFNRLVGVIIVTIYYTTNGYSDGWQFFRSFASLI
jgi:hypothetical protein